MLRGLLFLALTAITAQAGFSKLEAISLIETGNNDRAIGSAGEVSRYQIMPAVWRSYSRSRAYQNTALATRVANQHLIFLENFYRQRTGREPSDFDRYVMWNAGPNYYARRGFSPLRVHRSIRERANRFVNLREMKPQPGGGMFALVP